MSEGKRLQARLRVIAVLIILALAIFVTVSAWDFRRAARLFPEYVGMATILLCLIELARQILRRTLIAPDRPETADIGLDPEDLTRAGMLKGLALFGWVGGYMVLVWALGMAAATILFIPALLHLRFRSDWRITAGIVAGLLVLMALLQTLLALRLPPGILGLPMPF